MRSFSAAFVAGFSWASRHLRSLLVLLLALGAVLAVAQTAGSSTGGDPKKDQSAFDLNPSVGGGRAAGTAEEPTAAGSLLPSHSVTALSVDDGLGGFSFTYSYTPSVAAYNNAVLTGYYQRYHYGGPTYPPFGHSPKNPDAQHFWHNLSSFVQVWLDKCDSVAGPECTNDVSWIFRTPSGQSITVEPCAGDAFKPDPLGKPACITDRSRDAGFGPGERLAWDGLGFVYYTPAARYYYRQRLGGGSNVSGSPSYYLSWVEDAQYGESDSGRRKKVAISYGVPPGCTTAGGTDPAGFPKEAALFNGARLTFSYKELPATYPGAALGAKECVLASVDLVPATADGGVGTQQVATFTYTGQTVNGVNQEVAGLLSGTTLGIAGTAYDYGYGQSGTSWTAYKDGRVVTQKTYKFYLVDGGTSSTPVQGNEAFSTQTDYGEDRTWTIDDMEPGLDTYGYSQTFSTTQASQGDGSGRPATLVERVYLSDQGTGPLVAARASNCYGTAACGANENYSRWSFTNVNSYVVSAGEKSPGGAWTQYQYADGGTTDGGYYGLRYAPELTRAETGKPSLTSTSYTAYENRTFVYLETPKTGEQNAVEQLVKTVSAASLLDASQVVQRRVYDLNTRRIMALFVTGRTRSLDAANGTTSLVTRTVATFFRTTIGTGSTPDLYGRTLEQVGPCEVASFDQTLPDVSLPTDCARPPANTVVSVPIVRFTYYGDNAGNNSRRLASTKRYPAATLDSSGTVSLGTELTTTYEAYDVLGHPTRVKDENGVVTESLYSGDRLVQTSVLKPGFESDMAQATVTRYEYEGGFLRRMQKPDGDWEVYCYRANADVACTGQLTGHLQWKATAYKDEKSAARWFEKTVYGYRSGQLVSEKVYDAQGTVRREVRYDPDPLGRQTFAQVGTTSGDYVTNSVYGSDGAKAALGQPYNRTPALCITPGSYDPTCTEEPTLDENGKPLPSFPSCPVATLDPSCHAWSYDTLGRLTKLLEPVGEGLPQAATCVTYDARGNLKSLSRGAGSCSSQADATFEYDDFGNLLSFTAVWLGTAGSSGTVRFGYDARGNLVKKQTPAMAAASPRQWLEYTYDAAGRMTSASAAGGTASPVLYKLWYDTSFPSDKVCGAPYPDLTANTQGRIQAREDSFGTTFYSYDHLGRVTKQVRRRKGAGCTPSNPTRDYLVSTSEYDAAGRLLNETYPHGRKLLYAYHNTSGSEGLAPSSRVKSISMLKYLSATQSGAEVPLLSDIRWEPYGRVRSYRAYTGLAGAGKTEALVEYLTGNNTSPLRTCADGRPDGASDGTGRVAGLWVSRGEDTAKTGGIFKRSYLWQADQLTEQATCFLRSSGTPQTERFGYDRSLRLTSATRPSGNFAATGAAWGKREYGLSATGARQKDTQDCWEFTNSNEGSTDRVLARTATANQCAGVCRAYGLSTTFTYDLDGRVNTKTVLDAQGGQASRLTFDAALDGQAAIGAVFRSITVKLGSTYSYYYDSFGRRRLKQYPVNSLSDEYFYDGDKLLEDQGNNDLKSATGNFVLDEYVWLDGRPVVLLKSRIRREGSGNWTRDGDDVVAGNSTACARNGEPAACGTYFIVSDYLGKPVLMLNAQRQVTGVADYDPFGYVNRVSYLGQARATSASSSRWATIGYFTQPILAKDSAGTALEEVHVQARFANVDTDDGATDFAYLTEKSGTELTPGLTLAGTVATSNASVGGAGLGPTQTPWVKMPASGQVHVRFKSDGAADPSRLGVTLEGYEYRRFQAGASWVWTPLRFPGQYHDAETDLLENWNRYYDPSIGRYLGPEPMYQQSEEIARRAAGGAMLPVYAYASNNPIGRTDATGLLDEETKSNLSDVFNEFCGGSEGCVTALNATLAVSDAVDKLFYVSRSEQPKLSNGQPLKLAGVFITMSPMPVPGAAGAAAGAAEVELTAEQAANLARFNQKLPAGANATQVQELPGGGRAFQAEVPGRVPGSSAIYEKQVDSAGRTLQYTKTTIDPKGSVVHVKDKLNGTVVTP